MDLTPIADLARGVATLCVVPIAGLLTSKLLRLAQTKLHLQLSESDQAAVQAAVTTGAGILRAKLAAGEMTIPEVTLGSPHVDQAAQFALDVAERAAMSTNISKDDVAKRIIGAVGHALGDDPGVLSVAVPVPPAPAVAAAA